MPVLIGSRALAHWDKTFPLREDADWDIICRPELVSVFEDLKEFEWHDFNHLNNKTACELSYIFGEGPENYMMIGKTSVRVAPPDVLAAIKRSHLWRDLSFGKHITQYHKHLKPYLSDRVQDFLIERTKLTKKAYPQGNPNLNQRNEDFFDDAVEKKYDHDMIHEFAAYYDKPLYTRLKYDDSLAWCEKDLWGKLDHLDKIKCVAEETFVIATERFLVRSDWTSSYRGAYMEALKKVCTTLTSGYFRGFALDHYPEIVAQFDKQKLEGIKEKLNNV